MKVALLFLLLFCFGCRDNRRQEETWAFEYEGLKLTKSTVQLGVAYFGEEVADTIRIMNVSRQPWEGRFNYDMHFMLVKAVPYRLEPCERGMIVVRFNTRLYGKYDEYVGGILCEDYGKVAVPLYLPVNAQVVENFNALTSRDREEAPEIVVDAREYDFGRVAAGEKVEWEVRLSNRGRKDLIIRNIKTGCGCTVAELDSRVIRPGGCGWLKVAFRTTGRSGHQRKTITLTTNDYRHQQLLLTIEGEVVLPS